MAISIESAIQSARNFAISRKRNAWNEESIKVYPEIVDQRHAWVVEVEDALNPGEEPWMMIGYHGLRYFVDACTGEFFGFATERSRTILKLPEEISSKTDSCQESVCNIAISKSEALESARNFELKKGCVKDWDDPHIKITPEIIEGRHAWVVAAYDVLLPGEEPWMMMLVQPTLYFVDACTGELFGVGGERFRQIFKSKEP